MVRIMKILTKALLLGALCGLPGCGLGNAEPEQASNQMEITVNLQDIHRCSVISPEIQVFNAPKDTTVFDVRLVEVNGQEEKSLGGGTWPADSSGIIPEGAFTGRYRGPCPPDGSKRKYFFLVAARKGSDVQPLAVRLYNFELE